MFKIFSCFLILMLTYSCRKDKINIEPKTEAYSFFVAGHSYGSPSNYMGGLYSPFVSKFSLINQDSTIKMGFLTGDIVKYSTPLYWDLADYDLSLLNVPTNFAVGNHDVTDLPLYTSRYGETYYSFLFYEDLYIVLDGNLDGWRISGKQLEFLKETIESYKSISKNIFIFSSQVIYADTKGVNYNSPEGKIDPLNFNTEVLPILKQTGKNVYLFAGDVGAFDWGTPLFYEQESNITYIASGMGGGIKDNFLIVSVDTDKKVNFKIVALNGNDINALGDIEQY